MDRPNILLIVLDAGRADRIGCYGYDRQTTAHLDRVAASGLRYKTCISPAVWTAPSHASLFTGVYPYVHGVNGRQWHLPDHLHTLAGTLQAGGYETAAFTANRLIGSLTGLDRGFCHFRETLALFQKVTSPRWQTKLNQAWIRFVGRRQDDGAAQTNRLLRRWLANSWDRHRPFFIFVNYLEPHLPYRYRAQITPRFMPPGIGKEQIHKVIHKNAWRYIAGEEQMSETDLEILAGLYDGELAYVDRRMAELDQWLERQGHTENLLLIVTADHGENLGDHGLMDHHFCVYDTLAHVPLLVRWPAGLPSGEVVDELVQTHDLAPTLARYAGDKAASLVEQSQGSPIWPDDLKEEKRDHALIEYLEPQIRNFDKRGIDADVKRFDRSLRAIRTKGHKYIWSSDEQYELYDLSADSTETNDVIEEESEMARRLAQCLPPPLSSARQNDTQGHHAVEDRLRDLGYLA